MLEDVAPILRKLAYRGSLSADEARKALNEIGDEDVITDPKNSDGMYFLALTLGVMAKGPTAEELYGFVLSLADRSAKFNPRIRPSDVTDISGSGGDALSTFNIGTTASFLIAAAGLNVAKQATRAYTSVTGSADIFRELGVDVFQETDQKRVETCLEKVGIAAFYTPAFTRGFANRVAFLTKTKTIGLNYPTPWHLVSWVYSPVKMDTRVYGVFDQGFVRVLAELFVKLGYKRGMVVHGTDGLDELSIVGPTAVAEYRDGEIEEYTVTPEQVGLRRATVDELTGVAEGVEDREAKADLNKADFFRVIYGEETGAKRDMVVLNAAASLYVAGRAKDLSEAVKLASSTIEQGKAASKLEAFVDFMNARENLKQWKKRLGISR